MSVGTVLLFLFILLGLGSNIFFFIKHRNIYEMILISIVVGLGALPPALFLMSLFSIPLDFRILLFLAFLGPAVLILRTKKVDLKLDTERTVCLIIVLVGVVWLTHMLFVGSQTYPWLENDDPWQHALGAKQVALFKTSEANEIAGRYLEPYPPYYTSTMGILHQTNSDLQWILKFFNALIVGLSLIAAFFVFGVLMKSQIKATAGTLILGMMPAYMSHFIWAQTLAIPVFLIALWALAQVESKKNFWKGEYFFPATILVWSATIVQPSTAIYFALFFILYASVKAILQKIDKKNIEWSTSLAIISGGSLSFLTWVSFMIRYGPGKVFEVIGVTGNMFFKNEFLKKTFGKFFESIGLSEFNDSLTDTGGGIIYSFSDIIFAPLSSKIDQATGLGWPVAILAFVGLIILFMNWRKVFSVKNHDYVFVIVLFIFTLLALQAEAFSIKLFPHRVWVLFAIPIAILTAQGIATLGQIFPKDKRIQISIIVVLTLFVLFVNMEPRMAVQQAQWPPGVFWSSQQELNGYVQMSASIPEGSKVFPMCDHPAKAIGFNFNTDFWDGEQNSFKQKLENKTGQEGLVFLDNNQYQYFIISTNCISNWGLNETQEFVNEMGATGRIKPALQLDGFFVGEVV